ncbi:MAG: ribosome maturation factor RimP [Candidatus Gastranaerophilales bacterium]|nr:ribosome maturation factor RimP [Candidatus Gastranaerophilales bacterium]
MGKEKYNNSRVEKNTQYEYLNKHELIEKLNPLIDNTLMRYSLIPVETELVKENHKWFLRIFIYSKEREVNLDDCEKVSRSLAEFLEELIPFKYYLEVSSPGVERKIKSNKEYLIFKGKNIIIKLKEPVDESNEKQFVAEIIDFDDNEGLTLFVYKDKKNILIKKDNIVSARLYSSEI